MLNFQFLRYILTEKKLYAILIKTKPKEMSKMNYRESIDYIHSIPKFIRPLGNAQLSHLLYLLGEPQNKLKFIHVAGTNGKGSVCAVTAEILKSAGYKTGLFTSPFIEVFNERIRINGENIPDDALAEYISHVKNVMTENDISVSEFAFITAAAFLYFFDEGCDFVVLETGMGGRLDATNVIPCPLVSVITSISLDHTQYLGNTTEEITLEKCGIIKSNGTVVSYPNENVIHIIRNECKKNNAALMEVQHAIIFENGFEYRGRKYPLALKGNYQPQNAAAALEVIFALRRMNIDIPDAAVNDGLKNVHWNARFEFIRDNLIIDGGHNPDGIRTLKRSLLSLGKPVIIVIAMMDDKACGECMNEIAEIADTLITTELPMPRCKKADILLNYSKKNGVAITDCKKAVEYALALAKNDSVVCVCGSLYLAGEVRKAFKQTF